MSNLIIAFIVLCILIVFLKEHPVYLIIIAIAIISVLIINIVNKEKQKREKAAETWRKEQEQKEKEHKKYIEEQERQKRLREEERRREEFLKKRYDIFNQKLNFLKKYEIEFSDEKHNRNSSLYLECKNVTKATPLKKIKDFIAIDTETTGLKAAGNDIIQLSAIKFENFEPVEIFSTYLKPRKSIPEEATKINGITDEMVADAPKFYQIINSLNKFIGDFPLIAHNAPFDMKHLYANGLDSIENKIVYDTLELSKKLIPDAYSYKLKDICEQCCIYFDDAHNSDSDSLAAGLLFVELVAERKEMTVEELINLVG